MTPATRKIARRAIKMALLCAISAMLISSSSPISVEIRFARHLVMSSATAPSSARMPLAKCKTARSATRVDLTSAMSARKATNSMAASVRRTSHAKSNTALTVVPTEKFAPLVWAGTT